MALSDSKKLDLVFKSRVGREETTTAKIWYEEFPANAIYLHASEVYADPIPETPPASSTSVIQVYDTLTLTEDNSVSNHKSWKAYSTPGDTSSERLTHFIHPRFGQGYTVRVYDNNNNEIPTTDDSKWFFDYETGVLTFEEDPTAHGWALPIKIKAYRYIGNFLDAGASQSGGKYDVIINQSYIPDYVGNNTGVIQGIIVNHIYPTGIVDKATFYSTHYKRFKWQLIGSVNGAYDEQHFDTYGDLVNYIINTRSVTTESLTLILKHTVDLTYPTIDYVFGYNVFYAVLKSRNKYYKKKWNLEMNENNWEKTADFVNGLYNFYFGIDTSSQNINDLARTVWFPINYKKLYRPIPIGMKISAGTLHTTPVSGQNNRAFWDDNGVQVVYDAITTPMVVVDRFIAWRADRNTIYFANRPMKTFLDPTRSIESVVIVYVLHEPTKGYYAFLIKPMGQDKFVIYNDPRISNMGLDLYAVYEDNTTQLRRWYRNLSQTLSFSETDKDSAQAKYIIDRRDLVESSTYPEIMTKTRDTKHPYFKVRFMWADADGNTSPISRVFIAGRVYPPILPEFLVRTG